MFKKTNTNPNLQGTSKQLSNQQELSFLPCAFTNIPFISSHSSSQVSNCIGLCGGDAFVLKPHPEDEKACQRKGLFASFCCLCHMTKQTSLQLDVTRVRRKTKDFYQACLIPNILWQNPYVPSYDLFVISAHYATDIKNEGATFLDKRKSPTQKLAFTDISSHKCQRRGSAPALF